MNELKICVAVSVTRTYHNYKYPWPCPEINCRTPEYDVLLADDVDTGVTLLAADFCGKNNQRQIKSKQYITRFFH